MFVAMLFHPSQPFTIASKSINQCLFWMYMYQAYTKEMVGIYKSCNVYVEKFTQTIEINGSKNVHFPKILISF